MGTAKIRLILADDHALFREIIMGILGSWHGGAVVAQASNADELLDVVERVEADVLVMDISMPGAKGTSLVRAVHQRIPGLPILVLSMHDEAVLVKDAFRSGARGYITKSIQPGELEQAIVTVAQGGRFISPSLGELPYTEGDALEPGGPDRLSERERQILDLLVGDGFPLVKVAALLGLSPKTVTTHKSNIMAKLGVSSNAELMQYVYSRAASPDEVVPTRTRR